MKRITATTGLLTIIKRGGSIYLDGMCHKLVRRSAFQKQIIAENKYKYRESRYPLSRKGLQEALDWLQGDLS